MATAPVSFQNTNDPRKASANQRQYLTAQGDQLQTQYGQQYNQQQGGAPVNTVQSTANYLNDIEDPLAQGQGGYNSDESSQIELTPQQKENIASNAGVTAGSVTQAGVGAADRAAAAAGGNPLALAAYRARAADTAGSQAGAATIAGEIAGQQAGSAGAQAVGNARLAQQNQGLNYYTGQNTQANQNAQQANQLQEQTYNTEANAGNTATSNVIGASQTPSTSDKVIGGITGALGALADGTTPKQADAVVGENGPEWVGKPNYLDDGDPDAISEIDPAQSYGTNTPTPASVPFWKKLQQGISQQRPQTAQSKQPWNTTTPYSQVGSAIGGLTKLAFLEDGDAMPAYGMPADHMPDDPFPPARSAPPRSMLAQGKVITKPTAVKLEPGEAVVPLSYRASAKVRPSVAMKKPMGRQMYGQAA